MSRNSKRGDSEWVPMRHLAENERTPQGIRGELLAYGYITPKNVPTPKAQKERLVNHCWNNGEYWNRTRWREVEAELLENEAHQGA